MVPDPNGESLGPSKVIPSLISSLSRSVIISRPGLGDVSGIVSFILASGINMGSDRIREEWQEAWAFAIPAAFCQAVLDFRGMF